MGLSYKDAGVDKTKGYEEVKLIKGLVKKTHDKNVLTDIGGFGALYSLAGFDMEEPVLVSGTDGVGTKLKFAFALDKHTTIGQDAVAMCVNDVLCQGAKPLFFLDYIATGKLEPEKMADIVQGVADGCKESLCSLIGGETAEMPGFYQDGEYDIAGFCVGIVDKKNMLGPDRVQAGDVLIGLPSSGVHSNGFSLVRKIVFERMGMEASDQVEELGCSIGEALLTPTKLYVKPVLPLIEKGWIQSMAHITGGGFYENIPRALPDNLHAKVSLEGYEIPTIFQLLQKWGGVTTEEMFGTFNMGTGLVLVVRPKDAQPVKEALKEAGEEFFELGTVEEGAGELDLDLCL